ncbi:hypothetical protein KSP40_PGU001329 [Platanthera guangdongensis]|uniref:Uncharacterized protein n=1 Tax=Platanthera guangdongensis TaxID=2320717 RepID=A0ABR2MRK0_9ASPA
MAEERKGSFLKVHPGTDPVETGGLLGAFFSSLTAKGDPALATPMRTKKIVKRSTRKDPVRPTGEISQSLKLAEKEVRHANISARDAVDAEPLRSEKMVTSDSAPSQKTATSADTTGEHIEADVSSPNAPVQIVDLDEEDRRTEVEDDPPSKSLSTVNPEPVRENQPELGGSAADSAEKAAKRRKRKRDGATIVERPSVKETADNAASSQRVEELSAESDSSASSSDTGSSHSGSASSTGSDSSGSGSGGYSPEVDIVGDSPAPPEKKQRNI